MSRSNNHQSDNDDNLSSSDTNTLSITNESTLNVNDSQDYDHESIGGLASFVKSSTIHNDACKLLLFRLINSKQFKS
jgi:hypothetical protein